jgi:small subunit ribosomal protein S15
MIPKEKKKEIIESFKTHEKDTGSPEVQVSLITRRMKELVDHLKTHKKDHNSRRGLLILVGQRKRQLEYLSRKAPARYKALITKLGL